MDGFCCVVSYIVNKRLSSSASWILPPHVVLDHPRGWQKMSIFMQLTFPTKSKVQGEIKVMSSSMLKEVHHHRSNFKYAVVLVLFEARV